jgi:Uri superfamily endonuclease
MSNGAGSIPRSVVTLFRRWELAAVADPHKLKGQLGHYLLLLRMPAVKITIGALGPLRLDAGLYGYVGSARGRSVTLGHRLARHLRRRKIRRWHIDYLTSLPAVTIIGAYWTADPTITEAGLAIRCAERFPVIRQFGNADVRGGAPGHLFLLASSRGEPALTSLRGEPRM